MTTNNPQQPRLGPAWRGKGTGFQPPPAVPDKRPSSSEGRNRSGSNASGGERRNPFSALEEDEGGNSGTPSESGGRFSALSSRGGGGYHRSASSGQGKPRSLADLAAAAPPRRNTLHSNFAGGGGGGGSFADNEKVIRYTREKLLSLRPRPKEGEGLPDCLKGMEGSVVVSTVAQDPGEFCCCLFLLFWSCCHEGCKCCRQSTGCRACFS